MNGGTMAFPEHHSQDGTVCERAETSLARIAQSMHNAVSVYLGALDVVKGVNADCIPVTAQTRRHKEC